MIINNKAISEKFGTLPDEVSNIFTNYESEENKIGWSDATVFMIKSYGGQRNAYLKIHPKRRPDNLLHEKDVLDWLDGKLPVPKTLMYCENDYHEFLLLSGIEGVSSFSNELRNDISLLMENLAKSLKMIHAIDISGCPFDETIESKIKIISGNIENGFVDPSTFEEENRNKSPEEIFLTIIENIPDNEDFVFTHGDFCMPNILFNGNKLSGFIDWGRAGKCDRYQDISLMLRSLKYNGFTDGDCKRFLDSYGIDILDEKKVKFYKFIDELY